MPADMFNFEEIDLWEMSNVFRRIRWEYSLPRRSEIVCVGYFLAGVLKVEFVEADLGKTGSNGRVGEVALVLLLHRDSTILRKFSRNFSDNTNVPISLI